MAIEDLTLGQIKALKDRLSDELLATIKKFSEENDVILDDISIDIDSQSLEAYGLVEPIFSSRTVVVDRIKFRGEEWRH